MKKDTINKLYQNLHITDIGYMKSIESKYDIFMNYSQLPLVYKSNDIDIMNLCPKSKKLYLNITDIISNRYNIGIQLSSYKDSGFITYMLMEKYFYDISFNDGHLFNVLYIDTNLLMKDYKKLIEKGSDNVDINLTHSLNTLQIDIEQADFVFWDKFSMIQSNYEISKLYDILSIRYRNCLGNMFFSNKPINDLSDMLSLEMTNVMDVDIILDLEHETFKYREDDVLQL